MVFLPAIFDRLMKTFVNTQHSTKLMCELILSDIYGNFYVISLTKIITTTKFENQLPKKWNRFSVFKP